MNDVVIIGKGKHAVRNIYPSLRELGITIAAVASRNAEEAQEFVRQWNPDGHGYGDYRKMLDQEPASHVIVVMQAKDAVPVVRECLLHHKQVFVEKPLGMNSAEAEADRRSGEAERRPRAGRIHEAVCAVLRHDQRPDRIPGAGTGPFLPLCF
jgi:predicted dehydrogenase